MYLREILWLLTWPATIAAVYFIVKAVMKKKELL